MNIRKRQTFREKVEHDDLSQVVNPGDPHDLVDYSVTKPMSGMSLAHLQNIIMYMVQNQPQMLQETSPYYGSLKELMSWLSESIEQMGKDLKFGTMPKHRVEINQDNEITVHKHKEEK